MFQRLKKPPNGGLVLFLLLRSRGNSLSWLFELLTLKVGTDCKSARSGYYFVKIYKVPIDDKENNSKYKNFEFILNLSLNQKYNDRSGKKNMIITIGSHRISNIAPTIA